MKTENIAGLRMILVILSGSLPSTVTERTTSRSSPLCFFQVFSPKFECQGTKEFRRPAQLGAH